MDARQEIINKLNEAIILVNAAFNVEPVEPIHYDTRLTANFRLGEFLKNSGFPAGYQVPDDIFENITNLAHQLETIRAAINAPIIINSGLRSTEKNSAVGGAKQSRHLTGEAADIRANGYTPAELRNIIKDLMTSGKIIEGGLKAYANHVHYDIRGFYVSW